MLTITIILGIVGLLGQWLDGLTTWQGVKKFGPSIESNKSAFAQFFIKHPSTLLYLKTLMMGAALGAIAYVCYIYNPAAYPVVWLLSALCGALGYYDAYENNKTNSAKTLP